MTGFDRTVYNEKMNILLTCAAVAVLIVGVYFGANKDNSPQETSRGVLSQETIAEVDDKIATSPTQIPPSSTSIPNSPTSKPNQQVDSSLHAFVYPGSTILASSSTSLSLESNESTEAVTDWYKNLIKSMGMTATSFVTTSTNGAVLNKLAAAKSDFEVLVEITKAANDQVVKIKATLQ